MRHNSPSFANGLPAPGMRNLVHQPVSDADSLARALQPMGTLVSLQPLETGGDGSNYAGQLSINALPLLSFSASGMHCVLDPLPDVMVAACFDGRPLVQDPNGLAHSQAGGAVLMPMGDGARLYSSSRAASAVAMTMPPAALHQVASAIAGVPQDGSIHPRQFARFSLRALSAPQTKPLYSLLRHIDDGIGVDASLPARLGLDDVLLRWVATWIHPELLVEQSSDRLRIREQSGTSAFDELIDYIRANLDQPLRLSDLEARSFYSRRALQYAFREKLGTTPVQWIREQRLAKAMEQLQHQGATLSIRAVALACGYRQTSQFSADFKRRFGLSPSQVRRPSLR